MLYTRTGDAGTSSLFGSGDRIPKDDAIFDALGTVDELNAVIGVCYAAVAVENGADASGIRAALRCVQEKLFIVQAELAGADKHLSQKDIDTLEQETDRYEAAFEAPKGFIIPGTTLLSAHLDHARTVARRAERSVAALHEHLPSPTMLAYLNRLSSLLYALARATASAADEHEPSPSY